MSLRGAKRRSNLSALVYIALGSNISPRTSFLRRGLQALQENGIRVKAVSSLYRTSPMHVKNQPYFLNAVIKAETTFTPQKLLNLLKRIEKACGRVGGKRFGPRALDLDLLLYRIGPHWMQIKTPRLTLPHPRMAQRKFVLIPLLEISPRLKSLNGMLYQSLLNTLYTDETVKRYKAFWIKM